MIRQRNALIALDNFLGATAAELAEKHNVSPPTVYNVIRDFKERRADVLRFYYKNDENRNAVAEEFSKASEPEAVHDQLAAMNDQMATMEQKLSVMENNLTELMAAVRGAKPTPEPLPALNIGSQAPKAKRQSISVVDADIRQTYRAHVTHQANEQWVNIIGAGTFNDQQVPDIRKRILGFFFKGKLEGKGVVYTVTDVERYSLKGIRLNCTLQGDMLHICQVQEVSLKEI